MDFEMRTPSLNLVLTEMASTPTRYNETVSRFQGDGKCFLAPTGDSMKKKILSAGKYMSLKCVLNLLIKVHLTLVFSTKHSEAQNHEMPSG